MTIKLTKKNLICQIKQSGDHLVLDSSSVRDPLDPKIYAANNNKFVDEINNNKFVYKISRYTRETGPRTPDYEERGIAHLEGSKIVRLELIDCHKNGRSSHKKFAKFSENEILCLESIYPESSIPLENAIFTSESIVQLNSKECMILCDANGKIGAASFSVIAEYLKSLKPIELSSIRLAGSSRPQKPKDGTLIYNKRTGNLEFYNGSGWVDLT